MEEDSEEMKTGMGRCLKQPPIPKLDREGDSMKLDQLSEREIEALKNKGWDFVQVGPDEWSWIKFDSNGWAEAMGGSAIWVADLDSIKNEGEPYVQ